MFAVCGAFKSTETGVCYWVREVVAYSIVETAKANGLDVFKYLELILTVLPNKKFISNPDIYNEILPWNDKVKKICALTKEADL